MDSQTTTMNAIDHSFDFTRLNGKLCRLFPYVRGHYGRNVLYNLWSLMEEDGGSEMTFHGMPEGNHLPITIKGDLTDFVRYMSDPARILLMVQTKDEELAGFIWFDDYVPMFKASCNIFIAKKFRGEMVDEASWIALSYMFDFYHVEAIWAVTPWSSASNHALSLGFEMISVLPEFELYKGKLNDMRILRMTKEIYNGRKHR